MVVTRLLVLGTFVVVFFAVGLGAALAAAVVVGALAVVVSVLWHGSWRIEGRSEPPRPPERE